MPVPLDLDRRGFVQGMAGLGAVAAVGLPGRSAHATAATGEPASLSGDRFDLSLGRVEVNKTGAPAWANGINGHVPGPVLHWREGDVVTINLTNRLPVVTGVHWHGIILPNGMDGVPGLEFPGIQPGETFTYRFPVMQSGTYWYHSHMAYQEQKGAYGALVIEPRAEPLIQADRDYVVVLSDWTDADPTVIQNNLKQQSDYYDYHRRTLGTFIDDARRSGLSETIDERLAWGRMRMEPMGLAEPTGALYTYLMNGAPPAANWTALFRPGERVRLRIINASAVTYYDVRVPGLTMNVVHVHGNDVVPVPVDELRIGVAETYDVIVQPREAVAYTIFAQSLGRGGFARGTLAPRPGMQGPVPPMDVRPMRTMADMGMGKMAPGERGASNPDLTRIGGERMMAMGSGHGQPMKPMVKSPTLAPSERPHMNDAPSGMPGVVEQQMVPKMLTDRLNLPGDGLNQNGRRVLTYADLRSVRRGVDDRPPTREILLRLTGNMDRMIWGFNGKKFTEVGPIDVTLGERIRLRMINQTMMSHPIHLHGMWMELENGQGDHRPYLHTISVKPAEDLSLLVTPVATGQWPLHCHILYHFEAGMFLTVRVLPKVV